MERLTWDDIEALADANWHRRDAQGTMLDKVRAQFHAYTVELADARATVEALQAQLREGEAAYHEVGEYNDHLKQQVESLQRELEHAKKMEAVQKEVADNQTWHVRELRAALDAEREKVKGLEKWRINVTAALLRPGGAFYEDVPKHVKEMAEQLSQLQALVLAYCEAKVAFDDGRLREDHHAWKERFSKLELTEAALIDYTMRTLDATTPAGGQ